MAATLISVNTTVDAPIEEVWKYYSEPAHIMQWYNASPDWHTPKAINDLKTGGTFSYRMEAKDGSFGFDFSGLYDSVITNELIGYTMDDGRKATIAFSALTDATKVTIDFEAESENTIELQKNGWQAILDNFKNYVEKTA